MQKCRIINFSIQLCRIQHCAFCVKMRVRSKFLRFINPKAGVYFVDLIIEEERHGLVVSVHV